jgi:AmmeMemoRadiSam system protein A
MGELVFSCLVPHPPLMVKEIGGNDVAKVEQTINSLKKINSRLQELKPDTLVVITPHGAPFGDAVALTVEEELRGDFSYFNFPQLAFRFPNNRELVELIRQKAAKYNVLTIGLDEQTAEKYGVEIELDHGILAPLYYLGEGLKFRLVPVHMSFLEPLKLYRFGMAMQKAIIESHSKVALIISGDMSHCLTEDAPTGYNPKGKEFDQKIKELLADWDVPAIVKLDPDFVEEAAQCGYRSMVMGLGALDGFRVKSEILSYEAPYHVGYLVATFEPTGKDKKHSYYEQMKALQEKELEEARRNESPIVRYARLCVESYLLGKETPSPPDPAEVPSDLPKKAGVFVTIKKHGRLRGCIGTVRASKKNIWEEICRNAIDAATKDPRFSRVSAEELPELTYSVDILSPTEEVRSLNELDPKVYGIIVFQGSRRGLLLPDLAGVNTVRDQIRIACEKAGIKEGSKFDIVRFTVRRFT